MIEQAEPAGPTFPNTPTDELRRTGIRAAERGDYVRAVPRLREVARRTPDAHDDWQNLATRDGGSLVGGG